MLCYSLYENFMRKKTKGLSRESEIESICVCFSLFFLLLHKFLVSPTLRSYWRCPFSFSLENLTCSSSQIVSPNRVAVVQQLYQTSQKHTLPILT